MTNMTNQYCSECGMGLYPDEDMLCEDCAYDSLWEAEDDEEVA